MFKSGTICSHRDMQELERGWYLCLDKCGSQLVIYRMEPLYFLEDEIHLEMPYGRWVSRDKYEREMDDRGERKVDEVRGN